MLKTTGMVFWFVFRLHNLMKRFVAIFAIEAKINIKKSIRVELRNIFENKQLNKSWVSGPYINAFLNKLNFQRLYCL